MGRKTSWISCVGNINNDAETVNQWDNTHKKHLQQMVKMLTHGSVIESMDSLVFVVCISSASETKKMKSFVKGLSETVGGLKQMMFVYKEESHFDRIRDGLLGDPETMKETKEVSDTIAERSVKIEWSQLRTYIQENSRFDTISEKLVITSSNNPQAIPAKIVDLYSKCGLEILAYNECDELCSDPDVTEKANKSMEAFIKGKPPSWNVFYCSEEGTRIPFTGPVIKPLIERDMVKKIVRNLQSTAERTDKCMKIVPIDHLPGTGGTTIAKHVLSTILCNINPLKVAIAAERNYNVTRDKTRDFYSNT